MDNPEESQNNPVEMPEENLVENYLGSEEEDTEEATEEDTVPAEITEPTKDPEQEAAVEFNRRNSTTVISQPRSSIRRNSSFVSDTKSRSQTSVRGLGSVDRTSRLSVQETRSKASVEENKFVASVQQIRSKQSDQENRSTASVNEIRTHQKPKEELSKMFVTDIRSKHSIQGVGGSAHSIHEQSSKFLIKTIQAGVFESGSGFLQVEDKVPSETEEDFEFNMMKTKLEDMENVDEKNLIEKFHSVEKSQVDKIITATPSKIQNAERRGTIRADRIATAEVIFKPAAQEIQDPTLPLHLRFSKKYIPGGSVKGAKGGSNRQVAEMIKNDLQGYRYTCKAAWKPNPVCTVPMRAKRYQRELRLKPAPAVEEWRIWEEMCKEKRDHELAVKLGYETLVGNLLYINIPGAKDINRSWENFLSSDIMEWGFPYEKGSTERPRMKQPEPYLAHQVKEKLWKYPRSRAFQTTQEEGT